MKTFGKTKKLIALVSALTFALCSCGQTVIPGTTADTGASTGAATGAQTSAATQNPGGTASTATTGATTQNPGATPEDFKIPEPSVYGEYEIVRQKLFKGKISVNGEYVEKYMRAALLKRDGMLNDTMMYLDVLEDDGSIIASTMIGGYGFFAVSTPENGATTILRYSFSAAGERFELRTFVNVFSNLNSTNGSYNEKVSSATVESKGFNGIGTEEGSFFYHDEITMYANESSQLIDDMVNKYNYKFNIVLLSDKQGSYAATPEEGRVITPEMIKQIRSLDHAKVFKVMGEFLKEKE